MSRHKQPRIDPLVSDALRDHALVTRWHEKPKGRWYAKEFCQYDGGLAHMFKDMGMTPDSFPDYLLHALRSAETFAVNHDMDDLIRALSAGDSSMVPNQVDIDELPVPSGFIRLPKPLHMIDRHGVPYDIIAINWYVDSSRSYAIEPKHGYDYHVLRPRLLPPPHSVVTTPSYSDGQYSDALIGQEPAQAATEDTDASYAHAPGPIIVFGLWCSKKPEEEKFPGPWIFLLHFAYLSNFHLHAPWDEKAVRGELDLDPSLSFLEISAGARYVVLFWLIANQRIAVHHVHRPGDIMRGKARQARIVPRVRVIRLRRERDVEHPASKGGSIEYSHRWIVKKHTRWQPCGPGRNDLKKIEIDQYVKGPEDKPLIIKTGVFLLDR